MIKVGITGQSGFIGTHLAKAVRKAQDMELVPFEGSYFAHEEELRSFVGKCDAIVHLAAMSRAPSEEELYATNMRLVKALISAMEYKNVVPHVLFSSSTHEVRDTAYGRAKRDGRELLSRWAEGNGAPFTGFIFPNVYGPGARVFYASFIANFAWQLNHGQVPEIQVDASIKLIYIDHLVEIILSQIREKYGRSGGKVSQIAHYEVPCDFENKVSEVLSLFESFHKGQYANTTDRNMINLYNTFLSYA